MTIKAVLVHSEERFEAFKAKLEESGVEVMTVSFDDPGWVELDYADCHILVFYSSFEFSSSHPLALYRVYDNLVHIHRENPGLEIYPDPCLVHFYNDKYRQHLFLRSRGLPIPETVPLASARAVELAHQRLGYPMVVKNRYGAGGGAVFLVRNRKELESYYRISMLDFVHPGALRWLKGMLLKRMFFYNLLKARRMTYPFLSAPLLAQEFISTDRDLKTVVGDGRVVEGHWRFQASSGQWKVNIDGGGIGRWSRIPPEAIELSERLARELGASWVNLDLMPSGKGFLITEFSPVWHHYAYKEKPSFIYDDDYNLETPLSVSLDLEGIIVESLLKRAGSRQTGSCRGTA